MEAQQTEVKQRKKVYTFIQAFKEWKDSKPSESKMMLCPKKGTPEYVEVMEIYNAKKNQTIQ